MKSVFIRSQTRNLLAHQKKKQRKGNALPPKASVHQQSTKHILVLLHICNDHISINPLIVSIRCVFHLLFRLAHFSLLVFGRNVSAFDEEEDERLHNCVAVWPSHRESKRCNDRMPSELNAFHMCKDSVWEPNTGYMISIEQKINHRIASYLRFVHWFSCCLLFIVFFYGFPSSPPCYPVCAELQWFVFIYYWLAYRAWNENR